MGKLLNSIRNLPDCGGVYALRLNDEIIYIGSSKNQRERARNHKASMDNKHSSQALNGIWSEHDVDDFSFISLYSGEDYLEKELEYISVYDPSCNIIGSSSDYDGLKIPAEFNGSRKITLTIPDSIYELLERDRGMTPRSTWIQYLILTGGKEEIKTTKVGTIQNENSEKTKDTQGLIGRINSSEKFIPVSNDELEFLSKPDASDKLQSYSEVIEWIEKINDPEYQSDSEERSRVNKMVKDAGLSYNARDKKLWKQEGEKWILIKGF